MAQKKWNRNDLSELRNRLVALSDEKYRAFHSSLCKTSKYEILGVRLPLLRDMAKEISNENPEAFIKNVKCRYYEEIMLKALATAKLKMPFSEKAEYIENLIPDIDNWAVCDTFCSTLKPKKNELDGVLAFVKKHIFAEYEYEIRTAVVLALNCLVSENYIDELLALFDKTDCSYYYTSMAVAWAVSVCFVKCRKETLAYLKNCKLDGLTYKRTVQKICDSYRVTKEDKELVRKLKK